PLPRWSAAAEFGAVRRQPVDRDEHGDTVDRGLPIPGLARQLPGLRGGVRAYIPPEAQDGRVGQRPWGGGRGWGRLLRARRCVGPRGWLLRCRQVVLGPGAVNCHAEDTFRGRERVLGVTVREEQKTTREGQLLDLAAGGEIHLPLGGAVLQSQRKEPLVEV